MDRRERLLRRRVAPGAVLALTATAALVLAASPAGAAIGPVHTAPSSGAPGTTFTVSGSGCGPGVFVSGSDYVSVSSTGLPLNVHVPVSSAGSWSTTFSVPSGAPPVPALIAAACFTDGLPSLTTVYTPATFVVTATPAPTTLPPPPPPTSPTTSGSTGTTPTTNGTSASTKPGTKGSTTGGGTSTGSGSGLGSASGSGKAGRARSSGGRSGAGGAGTADGSIDRTAAKRAGAVAGLQSPELTSDSHRGPAGISPWWWALLALLVAGAIATWLWLRRRGASAPGGPDDPGPHGPTGMAEPDDALDDDWPAFPVLDEEPTINR
jgi:hypothetical protein